MFSAVQLWMDRASMGCYNHSISVRIFGSCPEVGFIYKGFVLTDCIPLCIFSSYTYNLQLATYNRLRKASLVRDHQTPSDFITDMFQSQLLRYAIITIQLVAQFIWMTSNVLAVKNAFNGAFNLDPNSPWM
jgi:hypothetical protein